MNAAAPVFVLGSSAQSLWDAANGVDTLTHAIESYTSRKRQPLTDTVALAAVKRIFRYLPTAYSNGSDLTARSEMAEDAIASGSPANTMKPVTKADVIRIYRGLWEK